MTKLPLLSAAAAVVAAGVALPFAGWALDVTDEDAVIEAYLDHIGAEGDADPDGVCVVSDAAFPAVAVVGAFAHDRGCMTQAIYVDGEWLHPSVASSAALHTAGWAEADDAGRAQLALLWADFGAFAFSTPVTALNEDFALPDAPAFQPPQSVPDGNAGAVVTMWVQEPGGMLPRAEYDLWELTFDRDGKTVRIRVLESYTVEY